jgi:UDP-GlcNAc:undecaprenyl-phosphate GlcNAc-1-phosphate transferase
MAIEAAAATLAFLAGARVHVVGDVGDWVLTVIWLVVLTNSFNLLDNMDGAAAAVSSATAIALTVAAVAGGQVFVGGLAAIAAGASIGFLLYNWHPARIFMGDAGSLFLGFVLASLALMLRFPGGHISGLVAVVFLAGPALFDTTLVVISRVRAGRPIFVGGTDHTSHRLIRLGLSSPAVVGILAVVTTASAGVGVVVGRGGLPPWVVVPAGGAVGTCLLLLLAERHDAAATVKAPEIPLSQAAVSLAD